jgi:hypothetical protein
MEANAARWIPPSPHQHHGGYTYLTATGSETSSCWLPFPQRTSTCTSTERKPLTRPPIPPPQFHPRMWQPWNNPINRPRPLTTGPLSIEMHPSAMVVMNSSSSCQSVASSSDGSSLDDMSRHSQNAANEGFSLSKSCPSAMTSESTPPPPLTALPVTSYYSGTISLATNRDSESLSPLHCFMRRYCVEAFSATEEEISSPRYGKSHSGRVVLGQVGIRCLHCKHRPSNNRQERAVCFPSSLKNIYHSIETWQRRHSLVCKDIPLWIKNSMTELIHNSRTGAGGRRQYWEESAERLGMATTNHGIRFIRPPGDLSPDNNTDWDNDGAASTLSSDDVRPSVSVVSVQDKELVTDYLFTLLEQMEACRFTEQDRSSGRSKVLLDFQACSASTVVARLVLVDTFQPMSWHFRLLIRIATFTITSSSVDVALNMCELAWSDSSLSKCSTRIDVDLASNSFNVCGIAYILMMVVISIQHVTSIMIVPRFAQPRPHSST